MQTGIPVLGAPGPPETMGGLVCGGAVWGCFRAYMEKQYPQIWQFWAPKSAENLVPGRPGTKFSTPALNLVPGTAVHVLDSTKCTNLVLSSTTVQLQYMYYSCTAAQPYSSTQLYGCTAAQP